jgi:biopolymer transport protein ExbD
MRYLNILLFGFILLLVSCAQQAQAPAQPDENTAQVKVTADGRVLLNGTEVTIAELEAEFERLKGAGGRVLYYRENPDSEPHPIAEAVVQAIVDAELPVQFSETDFQ